MKPDLVKFLRECANYFRGRDTGGEDIAHWANVTNAENCERAAAALERAQWQPISTAPRDGTTVLVGRWMDGWGFVRGYGRFESIGLGGVLVEGWVCQGFFDPPGNYGLGHPEYWMPVPEKPA